MVPIAKTRFSSVFDTLNSVLHCSSLVQMVANDDETSINPRTKKLLDDHWTFARFQQSLELIIPLQNLLKKAEASRFNLSDCFLGCLRLVFQLAKYFEDQGDKLDDHIKLDLRRYLSKG